MNKAPVIAASCMLAGGALLGYAAYEALDFNPQHTDWVERNARAERCAQSLGNTATHDITKQELPSACAPYAYTFTMKEVFVNYYNSSKESTSSITYTLPAKDNFLRAKIKTQAQGAKIDDYNNASTENGRKAISGVVVLYGMTAGFVAYKAGHRANLRRHDKLSPATS